MDLGIRARWLTAKKLGVYYNCSNGSHLSADCRAPSVCGKDGCSRRHHVLLHRDDPTLTKRNKIEVEKTVVCSTAHNGRKAVHLSIVPVKIGTPLGLIETLAFLDSGSDTTLIKHQFAQDYDLMHEPSNLIMTTLSGTSAYPCFKGKLKILSVGETNCITVEEAYTVKDIPIRPTSSIKQEASKWSHLCDVEFAELPNSEVTVLLGCDVPEAHWPLEQRISDKKQPYAIKTLLGWVMYGTLSRREHTTSMLINMYSSEHSIGGQLWMLYDQEFTDSSENSATLSREDKFALQLANNCTRSVDDRFEVPLPWNSSTQILPNNYVVARKRLDFLQRRLLQDEQFCEQYKAGMCKFIDKGYLELVTPEQSGANKVWYMPHHGVFHPKKPNKLRIVSDCAAKYKSVSLNDAMLWDLT